MDPPQELGERDPACSRKSPTGSPRQREAHTHPSPRSRSLFTEKLEAEVAPAVEPCSGWHMTPERTRVPCRLTSRHF